MAYDILNMLRVNSPATTTKLYLRTTAIVLNIAERILRRICFEIRKNNSNFYVLTIRVFLKEGPKANASKVFLLNTALLGFSGYFLQLNNIC